MSTIPLNTLYAMFLVLLLLIFSSWVAWKKSKDNPEKDYSELLLRIKSWWWMIGLVFLALISSKTISVIFFAMLSFLALKEYFSITHIRYSDRAVIFWAYLSIFVQYYWVYSDWYGLFMIFIPVYMLLLIPVRMVLTGDTKGFIHSVGVIYWGVMLTVYCISHVAYLLILPTNNPQAGPIGLVLFLLFTTQLNDVSQYVWGTMLGKHKIIPKVSPNKTWEGFIGGCLSTTLFSVVSAPWLTPLTIIQSLFIGALISIAGFFGDVVMSAVKRDLKIKDSGQFIPGHGGILDRLDSLIYTAPLFFHAIYYMVY